MARLSTTCSQGAMRVLAALVLADGERVASPDLAEVALPWGGAIETLCHHWIRTLRGLGCEIEGTLATGYRLLAVPPDPLLEPMLAMVPAVKRSPWWQARSAIASEASAA